MTEEATQVSEEAEPKLELLATNSAQQSLVRTRDLENVLAEYKKLQELLDKAMPDSMMDIQGKKFRKKKYWRGVKVHFRISIEILREERIEAPKGTAYPGLDWGYTFIVRATLPDGNFEDGDGSCSAMEKAVYQFTWTQGRNGRRQKEYAREGKNGKRIVDWDKTLENASVHNVRAHALTRAKNRAISDLVGFGEVSAEELPPSEFEKMYAESNEPKEAPAAPEPEPNIEPPSSESLPSDGASSPFASPPSDDVNDVLAGSPPANTETVIDQEGEVLSHNNLTYSEWDSMGNEAHKQGNHATAKQVIFLYNQCKKIKGWSKGQTDEIMSQFFHDGCKPWMLTKQEISHVLDDLKN